MDKYIFLDRDGTLNVEKSYLYKKEDFEWEEGAIEALKIFYELGYKIVIVTNQSGIARAYYTEEDLYRLNDFIKEELKKYDIKIEKILHCPHHVDGVGVYKKKCKCRKPGLELFEDVRKAGEIDYINSYMIGDKISDAEVAIRLGMEPILVKTGHGDEEIDKLYFKAKSFKNVYEAALYITDRKC